MSPELFDGGDAGMKYVPGGRGCGVKRAAPSTVLPTHCAGGTPQRL